MTMITQIQPDEATIVKGTCPHDCPDTCALVVTVKDGVAIKVEGDSEHPTTAGVLCAKVSKYTERTYHKDRLTTPLKRVGAKGSGQFVPVTWDEAIADIAAKLKAIAAVDAEAILPYSYAGTMGFVQGDGMAARFFHKLGASRLDRTICSAAGMAGLRYTLGGSVGMDVEQFQNAKLIILWGTNPVTSSVHLWTRVQEAKRNGARIIAIDPFNSDSAQKCHQHIAIKPGTDAALALSMMQVLFSENLLDQDYVTQYTLGADQLRARADQYPPEIAAKICGIQAQTIVNLAREYASTKRAAIRLNYGMQRVRGGANAVRAIVSLPALTGAWREPAGGVLLSSSAFYPLDTQALQRPDLCPTWPTLPRMVNMSTIGQALVQTETIAAATAATKPIRAIVVYNSNPVAVAPDSEQVIQGFAREDLFTVVLEHFQTDTADYADYVLPATTQLEHFDVHKSYGHWYVMANHPAIRPLAQAKPNSEIFRLLAKAMGFIDPAFSVDDIELGRSIFNWDHPRLAHATYEQLLEKSWLHLNIDKSVNPFARGGFPSPSGRCEFFSAPLQAQGFDPLPDYLPPYEPPTEQYPLQMISPPARNFLNTTFVNVDSLRKTEPKQRLLMHPIDAAQRRLDDGAAIRMFNDRGHCDLVVHLSERTREGLVVAPSIWWHKLAEGGRNVNSLTSQRITDLGEGPTFYDCAVQVIARAQCD
jgi:anaerobic selenocysteine-containing dehydrogenase